MPHFQCILISLEEPTHSSSEEADLITEHIDSLFKEQKRHTVMHSLRAWKDLQILCQSQVFSREVKVLNQFPEQNNSKQAGNAK